MQDSERRRIASELHDGVGQHLALLKINLSQLETASGIDEPKLISESLKLTDHAMQEVSGDLHLFQLHPPLLEELGFLSAARRYMDDYGKRGQATVSLQETLTNVYQYAAAQAVDVRIMRSDGHVPLDRVGRGEGNS